MRRPTTLLLALLLCTIGLTQLRAAPPTWPHERSDLAPDPAVVWGSLPNGLRYAILPQAAPREDGQPGETVSLRLVVRTGSLMEEDDQLGLAHFLEHMAFNGTRHFPAGEMVKYFQRLGMSFGAHTNAATSLDKTVYMLELPKNTDEYLDEALTLMADYADGMLLADEEIFRERGVILSEKLASDGAAVRTLVETIKFLLPETPIADRLPIGREEAIRRFAREDFVEFYEKWYTPDRMTLVVVGEVDPAAIAAKLTDRFGPIAPAAAEAVDPVIGRIAPAEGVVAKLYTEMETGQTGISLVALRPYVAGPDTVDSLRDELPLILANMMLDRRLQKLTVGDDPPFLTASANTVDYLELNFAEANCLELACRPEDWQRALSTGEQELRRALIHGFAAEERETVAGMLLAYLQDAAARADTRGTADLANSIVQNLADDTVFTHPSADLELFEKLLSETDLEACVAALREAWSADGLRIFVHGNLALEEGEAKIVEAFLASSQTPVDPQAGQEQIAWAYTDFGPAGSVAGREEIADLGVTLVELANNVRLTLKPTQLEADTIHVNVNFGAGRLTVPAGAPGLNVFAGDMFLHGGLGAHSLNDVNALCAGRSVRVNFRVDDEYFALFGTTNARDLDFQMQLLAAYLIDPGFRDDSMAAYGQNVEGLYDRLARDGDLTAATRVAGLLRPGDARFAFPPRDELAARTMDDLRAWMAPQLAKSWIEVTVVGDFDVQAAIDTAAATFGALPPREARPDFAAERRLVGAVATGEQTVHFTAEATKASVVVRWPTTDSRRYRLLGRHLDVLAAVLGDRVRETLREELGETYTPQVFSAMSGTFDGDGGLVCQFSCEAEHAASLAGIVADLGARIAAEGITADELERARQPLLTQIDALRRDNGWWLFVLADAQATPVRLDRLRALSADYEAATVEGISALAKQYLAAERAATVYVLPDAGTATAARIAP